MKINGRALYRNKNDTKLKIEELEKELLELRRTLEMLAEANPASYDLIRDALYDPCPTKRLDALKELDDEIMWSRATKDGDCDIRILALKKANNKELLEDAARYDQDRDVRIKILTYLNDYNMLREASLRDHSDYVKDYSDKVLNIKYILEYNCNKHENYFLKVLLLLLERFKHHSAIIKILQDAKDIDILKRGDLK